jgi:RHS repeat-associated protein
VGQGQPLGGIGRPTKRFNRKELDPESGLYYYGGRYYDPDLGRFVSPDPFVQEPGNPQNLNRYSYVLNNPQSYIDPSGYFFDKLFKWIGNLFKTVIRSIVYLAKTHNYCSLRWRSES